MTQAAAEDPGPEEALYQQARQELRSPKPAQVASLIYLALFLFFLAGQFSELKSVTGVAVLILALIFHEAGHAVGMRLFGFRDVRMFFIPFFGAAVSGRPRGVTAWKEALVSLLGPLPGIILGVVVMVAMRREPTPLLISVVQALLLLNVFNLLPLGFLDGGRFLERVLFSRHRVLAIGFQAIGALLLGAFALASSLWVLAIFAVFSLIALPLRWRILSAAATLRRQHPTMVSDPDRLEEPEGRAVFAAARGLLTGASREQPAALASTMESIVDGTKRAPGLPASLGLLALYGFGLLTGVVATALLVGDTGTASWKTFEQPEWQAEFPAPPREHQMQSESGEVIPIWRAVVEGTERFTVEASGGTAGAGGDSWMDRWAARLAEDTGTQLVESTPISVSGLPGRELRLTGPRRVVRARLVAAGSRRYQVVASAPSWGDNQQRFLDSFTLRSPTPAPP